MQLVSVHACWDKHLASWTISWQQSEKKTTEFGTHTRQTLHVENTFSENHIFNSMNYKWVDCIQTCRYTRTLNAAQTGYGDSFIAGYWSNPLTNPVTILSDQICAYRWTFNEPRLNMVLITEATKRLSHSLHIISALLPDMCLQMDPQRAQTKYGAGYWCYE